MLRNRSLLSDPFLSRANGLWPELDWFFTSFLSPQRASGGEWLPPMEVEETGEHIRYVLEVPGIRPEDIDVRVERNMLTISGEKKSEHAAENAAYHLSERRYGRFTRSFQLPAVVDAESVSAHYENGLLTITLPKVPAARPRQIRIETGAAPQLTEASGSTD